MTMDRQKAHPSQGVRVMKESVFHRRDRFVFYFLTVVSVFATVDFLLSWFRLEAWGDYPVMLSVMSVIVLLILGSAQGRWLLLPQMKRPKPLEVQPGRKVGVVTTIVPDIEPLFLLEKTVEALVALDYPHETWVLDEGDDERVKELCVKRGALHFSRKHYSQYQTDHGPFRKATKYGNYNAWLNEIGFKRYEFITAFDPDHIPKRTFLSKVLGYFEDPTIGYVQAPQVYSNQEFSFIARGASEESSAFYSTIQMASYGLGYPIIVGCHNTHRVSALREVGGFAPHDADDLLLTLLYRNRGWEGVYVPEVLARGLAPAEWGTYLNQQRRWSRSLLDLKLKVAPTLIHNLSWTSRLVNFLHGFHYLHKSFIMPVILLLIAVMLVGGEMPKFLNSETVLTGGLLLLIYQLCEWYRQRFYLDPKREQGLHWRAVLLQFAKWPYLIMAFFDVVFSRRFPYVVTSKIPGTTPVSFALWPHVLSLIMIGLAWGIGLSTHETVPIEAQFYAGTVMIITLALMATEWFDAPRSHSKP